ncbi:MAG: phosphatidylglycerol lysyltransferase domain-containing protein [Anaerolineales bacterium]
MKNRIAVSENIVVYLIAILTAAMGGINVLSAVTPSLNDRLKILETFLPFGVSTGGHLTSALAGFALFILSVSLWRRKQLGWVLTLVVLVISIVVHLIKGLDYEEAILASFLLGLLIYTRPQFHALSDRPSVRQGIQVALASLAFTLVYGLIGFYLLDKHYSVKFGIWEALRQTVLMFVEFYSPSLQPITGFGRYFADSIYAVGAITMAYALIMILRPVLASRIATDDQRAHAWEIIRAYGRTSQARVALFDDKLFFFTEGGSVLSYVVENRVALVLGDPIGPASDIDLAIDSFKKFCALNDWVPVFYQVMLTYLGSYKTAKFDAITIGQEAIVDLEKFTLEGSENKTLRNSFNKMVKLGYQYDVLQPPYSARMLRELNSISEEWLTSRGMAEMRFSLGWFDETYLNTCPILLVRDKEGFIEAFANLMTEFQANEIAVDLMRYRSVTESGLMDFLFVSLFQWAKEQGFSTFNLGLSAFSGVGEDTDDPVAERALNYIYRNVNRFYNFRGLHSFKEKFHPVWSPRYLIYPNPANLPAVSAAIFNANLGRSPFSLLRKD